MQILFSGAIPGPEEERGITALLGILDTETGEIVHRCEYRTPERERGKQKMQFTGFCFLDDELLACTHTGVVGFSDWPPSRPSRRISIPGFNDLHHCIPWREGLAVVNTGIETIDEVSLDGELLARHDLLTAHPGARAIDPACDYRLIADTKPHVVHANHLFVLDGTLWATQLDTRRAVAIDGSREIEIGVGMPHDGSPLGDRLTFTTVNGCVVFVDRDSLAAEAHDLGPMTPKRNALGWCRGICCDEDHPEQVYVAFTALRRTIWRDHAFRIKYQHRPPPSRIALYDLKRRRMIREYEVGGERHVLFQLHALPKRLWL